MHPSTRALTILAGVIALVAPVTFVPPATAAQAPSIGECRELSRPEVEARDSTVAAVDCTRRHSAETFFVGTAPASLPVPATATVRQLMDAQEQACTAERRDAYLGLQADFPNRFTVRAFFPTQAQWDAGERWVRCDLLIREALGYGRWTGTAPAWVAANDPGVFRYCTPSERFYGIPDARRLRAVACGKPASQWILVATPELGPVWSRYPGQRPVARKASQACQPLKNSYPGKVAKVAERGWYYVVPTSAGWAEGDRTAKCFVPLRQYLDTVAATTAPAQ